MIIEVSIQTINALGSIIIDTPYRSGPDLVTFFNQFGWQDEYGRGFPSRWKYAQSKIIELNKTEQTALLIEQAVDPRNFLGKEFDVEKIIENLNTFLQYDGYEVTKDGLHYRVRRKSGSGTERTPVKNLIFASTGLKPEIILRDALNNDIEIVKNAESCLIYDRHIPYEGLLWLTLVQWWAELQHLPFPSKDTEINLFQRLLESLASPPEQLLFRTYFRKFRVMMGDIFPALIPQVYLHYDPKSFQELKGEKRLARQRMDFLMLLPDNQRVVVEVDGKQHYAEADIASPQKYAEMVSADRELRLAGYEVYRFGGFELGEATGDKIVQQFFEKLLHK